MNTWKVILATLVIFGTGVVTGGLLVGYSDRAWRPTAPKPALGDAPPPAPAAPVPDSAREDRQTAVLPPPLRKDFVERLDRELNLSADQRSEIRKIVVEGQQRTRELWHLQWIETRQKIRAQLNPRQRIEFEQVLKPQPHDSRRLPVSDRSITNSPESGDSSSPLPTAPSKE